MKILYAIQGTGNGHLSRANDIVPILQKHSQVDLLLSGIQADVSIPFEIKYRLNGLSFIFGKKGGVDLWNTFMEARTKVLWNEIKSLPVRDYDLVINDFEPVSAWAARINRVPIISLSHQAAVINEKSPKPVESDKMGELILRNYAPSDISYGFHFEKYDENIFTPVIRNQVRQQVNRNDGHYTVYLPSYGDKKLIKKLSLFDVEWQVFSKYTKSPYKVNNLIIKPINNEDFIQSMATSQGVLCGAGFETPAEALFLEKKLMVVPMKAQYEQQCNAAALARMGVPVIKNLKEKRFPEIEHWLNHNESVKVSYPNETEEVINGILNFHSKEFRDLDLLETII